MYLLLLKCRHNYDPTGNVVVVFVVVVVDDDDDDDFVGNVVGCGGGDCVCGCVPLPRHPMRIPSLQYVQSGYEEDEYFFSHLA